MIRLFIPVFAVLTAISCSENPQNPSSSELVQKEIVEPLPIPQKSIINPVGKTIATRFSMPKGFERIAITEASFGHFLRQLPLKPHGAEVKLFDGSNKGNYGVYDAVVDLEIGKRDLHQCADAVMRLRADYLRKQKRYDEIHFNFVNGFKAEYSKWMQGQRIAVKGNNVSWTNNGTPSNSDKSYWKYLEMVFSYAGTLSLDKELKPVNKDNMQIGDVFIYGGSPGHAIIVVDMCENAETGEKLFLLAQSYMPAQEIQILKNRNNGDQDNPWYSLNFNTQLFTPEWSFYENDLKRF